MKASTFFQEFEYTGKARTVKGEILVEMNHHQELNQTADHKITIKINGSTQKVFDYHTEEEVIENMEHHINQMKMMTVDASNTEPEKSFSAKMEGFGFKRKFQ